MSQIGFSPEKSMKKTLMESVRLFFTSSRQKENKRINLSAKEMRFLIPFLKSQLSRYINLLLLLFISAVFSLPGPAITGYIFDKVFVLKDINKLDVLVVLLLGISIGGEFVRVVQDFQIIRLSQEFTYSIRVGLVERILRYPISFFREFQSGYLVYRLDEVNLLGNFFSGTILSFTENIIRFGGAIFLISRYNLKLTLIALSALPLIFEVARRSISTIRATSVGAMEKSAQVKGKIQETLSGIEIVKTYAKEMSEASAIRSGMRKMVDLEIIQNLFSSLSGRILGLITGLNLIAILWVGGREIIHGRLTVGQYVAFTAYVSFLIKPISIFAFTFLSIQRALMACKRISVFFDRTTEEESPERTWIMKGIRGDIKFENVHFHYEDSRDILVDISFLINKGEMVALIGKSGAGKSTLVNLILGLLNPTAGHIYIDDHDLRTVKLGSFRNRIGIVSQNIFLFDDTLVNNIRYSRPGARMEEVIAAAQAAGCHDFIGNFPQGYQTSANEIGMRLSGGEKQRISIARCLLKKPDIVIFDEPTSHLDPEAAQKLIASIRELFNKKTCLIVSHNLVCFQWVDRILVLNEGKIVQDGHPKDIIQKPGLYQELMNVQTINLPGSLPSLVD